MRLGTASLQVDTPVISSGALSLDLALGVGGFPKGRIVEIFGPESSGKTTLALHAIANAQKKGGIAVLIDAEYAFDAAYAKNLGVDIDNLLVSARYRRTGPGDCRHTGTQRSGGYNSCRQCRGAGSCAEIEGDMGDNHVGLQARLMSQALRKLTESFQNQKHALFYKSTSYENSVLCLATLRLQPVEMH